ncbi:MAG: PAC2 family protein [Elusimicrobiota bacterium]|nr:PAC2 family protein [Elusimicrobiota bacterium]
MEPNKLDNGKKLAGKQRWLVTAWPGMGTVAVTAVVYLLSRLKMRQIDEFDARELFEVEEAEVEDGLLHAARLPRSRLFLAEDAAPGLDIVVFLGEAQPPTGKFALSRRLLAEARNLGVTRVFAFAGWVSDMEPTTRSRVHGVSTDEDGLRDLRRQGVSVVSSGRITGLNGVLLAAAAEQGVPGVGLLGEMPGLAYQLPYPSASAAVLRTFASMAGMSLDLEELELYGRQTQEQLTAAYQQALKALGEGEPSERPDPQPEPPGGLSPEDVARIERLFGDAARDRAKAFALKTELDRLGAFRQYEDRFLALFKGDEPPRPP